MGGSGEDVWAHCRWVRGINSRHSGLFTAFLPNQGVCVIVRVRGEKGVRDRDDLGRVCLRSHKGGVFSEP